LDERPDGEPSEPCGERSMLAVRPVWIESDSGREEGGLFWIGLWSGELSCELICAVARSLEGEAGCEEGREAGREAKQEKGGREAGRRDDGGGREAAAPGEEAG